MTENGPQSCGKEMDDVRKTRINLFVKRVNENLFNPKVLKG